MAATFTDAFKEAGYQLTSPRIQWSSLSADGARVAITIWADEIDKTQEPWQFDCRGDPRIDEWINKPGNALRMRHLKHALERCGGKVDLILCRAENPKAVTRKVVAARWWKERIGLIQPGELDEDTGAFRVQLLPRAG